MSAFNSNSIRRWFAALTAALSLMSLPARLVLSVLLLWLSIDSRPATSAELFWDGIFGLDATPDGVFDLAGNWHDDQGMTVANAPTIGDSVIFDLSDAYTVTFTQDEAADELSGVAGNVTFASNSSTLRTFTLATGSADANISGGSLVIGTQTNPVFLNLPNLSTGGGLSASALTIGSTNDGFVTVDGPGSRLDVLGNAVHNIGHSGAVGGLLITNGATANIATQGGALNLGLSVVSTAQGDVTVDSGGTLNTGTIQIAALTSGATGSMSVSGDGSQINQMFPGAGLTIGSASGGAGTLQIFGGTFTTGTGDININATGSIHIDSGLPGGFFAKGDVNVNGGSITRTSGQFLLFPGRTLTATDGAQIDLGGSTALPGQTTWDITDGAELFGTGHIDINGAAITVSIDGAGSKLTTGSSNSSWKNGAEVNLRNEGAAELGGIRLASFGLGDTNGTTGVINVESGATMTTESLQVAFNGGATTDGTITVTGDGSTLTVLNGRLILGHELEGTATVNVLDGGTFTAAPPVTISGTTINATGTLDVGENGTFNADGPVAVDGGTILRSATGSFNLAAGKTLTASNEAQIVITGNYELDDGTTFQIETGADLSTTGSLNIGANVGDGTLIVDGNDGVDGSTLTAGAPSVWGASSFDGHVTLRNSATANLGDLLLGTGSPMALGSLQVESAAEATIGSLTVAEVDAAGSVTVTGPDSMITQTGTSTLDLGNSSNSGVVNVQSGGTFNSGTGPITIHDSGQLNVTGGTFSANGPITMTSGATLILDGGALTASAGLDNSAAGTFNFTDGTLTVGGGTYDDGSVDLVVDSTGAGDNPTLRIINGATANPAGQASIGHDGAGTMKIEAGGSVENADSVIGANAGSTGAVTVTGAGSTWVSSGQLSVGGNPQFALGTGSGTLTIADGGSVEAESGRIGYNNGSVGAVTVRGAGSTWTNTVTLAVGLGGIGTLTIEDGGTVSSTQAGVITTIGHDATGTASVIGAGSSWTVNSDLAVGLRGNGTLTIANGGSVSNHFGYIGEQPGSIGAANISGDGSIWTNQFDLGVGGLFSAGGEGTLTVGLGGTVSVGETLQIWDQGTVNLDGGTITAREIEFAGSTFNFNAGTLHITGDQALDSALLAKLFGPAQTISSGKTLIADGPAILSQALTLDGGTLAVGGLENASLLDFRRGTLALTNQAVAIESSGPFGDTLDLAADRTVNVEHGTTNRGLVTGDGRLGGTFHNDTDGELRAEPGRSLTLTGAGNTNNGQINLFAGLVEFTQDLTNNAGGFISGNGTLIARGGLVNEGTMNFSGAADLVGDVHNTAGGTIIAAGGGPTTFHDDVTNDGEIRTSAGGFSVFFGSVAGSGSFTGLGTVNFEGDLSPGSSPAQLQFGGNIHLGPPANLEIELAGTTMGDEFDALDIAGTANLDGTLAVSLLGGFTPALGDMFEIITASGGLNGTFASALLPELAGDLFWNIAYGSNSLTLAVAAPGLPGDYNNDSVVDAADYVLWRKSPSDFGGDPHGFNTWRANFGATSGSGALSHAAVPEPASALLLILGLGFVTWRGRRVTSRV